MTQTELLNTIRAEIERRKIAYRSSDNLQDAIRYDEITSLLPFLDTLQEPEADLEKKECELVTADEDIITIHLGKVLTEEQYDAVLRSVIDHLNKHWWHILRWSS